MLRATLNFARNYKADQTLTLTSIRFFDLSKELTHMIGKQNDYTEDENIAKFISIASIITISDTIMQW